MKDANFKDVNITNVDLRNVKNLPDLSSYPLICPETGSFVGYKAVK